MLISVFGVWLNPALVKYLVQDGRDTWAHFDNENGLRIEGRTADAVAAEINRRAKEAERPRIPPAPTGFLPSR